MGENIFSLPLEIIEIVLSYCPLEDVVNFRRTCRAFKRISVSPLWSKKIRETWPDLEAYKNSDVDWSEVYDDAMEVRKLCWETLRKMPALYYSTGSVLPDADLTAFTMEEAKNPELRRLYAKIYLVEICTRTIIYEQDYPVNDQLNMSHQYYAALILDHLNQLDLRKGAPTLFYDKNKVSPDRVLQFFSHWVEPKYGPTEKLIKLTINLLTERVHQLIPPDHPFHKIEQSVKLSWSEKLIADNYYSSKPSVLIINLVREVLEQEGFINQHSDQQATFDSFIIRNDINKISSNSVYSGIYFESVLRRCGVRCDLFYFAKHHLVVWREVWKDYSPVYLIDLFNGNITLSSNKCPYANRPTSASYSYDPLRLLETMALSFRDLVLYTNNRLRRNVLELMTLLNSAAHYGIGSQSYYNLFQQLADAKIQLNGFVKSQKIKKNRPPGLKFAVGMICYHKLYRYECIIRGWDSICMESNRWKRDMGVHRLEYGEKQPFYQVIAADCTGRYVAEENLIYFESPLRIDNIEDIIAQEFSHFNGYFYVPNEQKLSEYPEDLQVCLIERGACRG